MIRPALPLIPNRFAVLVMGNYGRLAAVAFMTAIQEACARIGAVTARNRGSYQGKL